MYFKIHTGVIRRPWILTLLFLNVLLMREHSFNYFNYLIYNVVELLSSDTIL